MRSSSESGGAVDVDVANLIGVKEELFFDFVVEVLACLFHRPAQSSSCSELLSFRVLEFIVAGVLELNSHA